MFLDETRRSMRKLSKASSTTMGNWVHAIIRCLDAQGVDGAETALRAGVRPQAIRNPEIRVPQAAVTQLWHRAVEATGNPCFGLAVPLYITPSTFGAFAYSLFASPSLSAVFRRIVRYHAFVTSGATPRFEVGTDRVGFTCIIDSTHEPADASIDAFFLMIVRMVKFLTGEWRVEPLAIRLRRPEPAGSERFHKAFRHRVEFGSTRDVLEYARADADRALPDADAAVTDRNDQIMARQLEAMGQQTLSAQVLHELLRILPEGPSEAAIARRTCLSQRHLHRLLAEEGTSYRALLDRARTELARSHLREGRYTIKEIAYLLGFSDAATFSRAFKRWTGDTPRRYAGSSA